MSYKLFLEELLINEAIKTSVVRVNKQRKRNLYPGRAAIRMAMSKNDASAKKYARFRMLMMKEKAKLRKKYGRKGMAIARKTLR